MTRLSKDCPFGGLDDFAWDGFGKDEIIVICAECGFPSYTVGVEGEGADGVTMEANVHPGNWFGGSGCAFRHFCLVGCC